MSSITVGDLIWIIDSDRHSIIPARVNEQIVSKTVSGEKTYHNIQFPSGKTQKLENLAAAWYPTVGGVRQHLLKKAQEVIEKSILDGMAIASKKFNITVETEDDIDHQVDLSQEVSGNNETPSDSVKVALDNGQIVNVKVPQEFLDENFSG